MIDRAAIRARLEAATPSPWGRYGPEGQGTMEAAPGQSIGSVTHTEPLARFSGYLLPCQANVELVIHAPSDLAALLAELARVEADKDVLAEQAESLGRDVNRLTRQCELEGRQRDSANLAAGDATRQRDEYRDVSSQEINANQRRANEAEARLAIAEAKLTEARAENERALTADIACQEASTKEIEALQAGLATARRQGQESVLMCGEAEVRLTAATEVAERVRWRAAVTAIHTVVIKAWPVWRWEDRRFLALALAGEVGEVANLVKKQWRGDSAPIEEKLAEELGDVRIYLELLAQAFGVDLDAMCERIVRYKLLTRWPEAQQAVDAALAVHAEAPAQEEPRGECRCLHSRALHVEQVGACVQLGCVCSAFEAGR